MIKGSWPRNHVIKIFESETKISMLINFNIFKIELIWYILSSLMVVVVVVVLVLVEEKVAVEVLMLL